MLKGKCMLFYIAQYPAYRTDQSALHFTPLPADLLILTATQSIQEIFSHAAITAQRQFTHIFPTLAIYEPGTHSYN